MTEAPSADSASSGTDMDGEDHQTVELSRQAADLSSVEDQDPPYVISGIAIGEGDVTRGQSGVMKKWPRSALEPAADSLADRPLVEDHDNSSRGVVGEVTHAEYEPGVGVLYKAELYDEELAKKVEQGLLEVSIRGYHGDAEEMAEDPETGAKVVEATVFDNLSIVPSGAAPSNTATMGDLEDERHAEASASIMVESGPSTEMSAAECAELLESDPPEDDDLEESAEDSDADGSDEDEDVEDELNEETPLDDETDEASNRGAGAGDEPEPTVTDAEQNTSTTIMSEEIEETLNDITEELSDLREEAVTEAELSETLDEVAEAGEEQTDESEADVAEELKEQFEDDLSELKERTKILDDVSREQVEDLREADDPKVVESEDHASLEGSVETVRGIYAEALAEHVDVSEERILDKWSLDEMKEDLEAEVEDSEEALSPGRKAEDVEEEELEEAAEEARETEEDELSEEIESEQDRLAQMISGN